MNDSEKTVKSFIKVYEDGTQEMSERGILITEFHDNENEEVKVTFDVSGFSMTDFLRLIYGVFVQFAKQGAFDGLIGSQDEEDSTW